MSLDSSANHREDRLSIRATIDEKNFLASAAKAKHMNVSQFVLQASLREAEKVIKEENEVLVSAKDFAWLCEIMDTALDAPRLRDALKQKPVWDV